MKRHHSQDYFIYLCKIVSNNTFDSEKFLWWEKDNLKGPHDRYIKNEDN